MVRLPDVNLTDEQQQILDTCPPPVKKKSLETSGLARRRPPAPGRLFRITAAAGAGKTTTLLALALRAHEQGHREIAYLTFTKASAEDGRRRIVAALRNAGIGGGVLVHASTLHSRAFRCLRDARRPEQDEDSELGVWDERRLKRWVAETCDDEIDDFLKPCYRQLEQWSSRRSGGGSARGGPNTVEQMKKRARRLVEHYIYKSLIVNFCQRAWTLEQYANPATWGRDYFPAKKYHNPGGDGEKLGFDPATYRSRIGFYAEQAIRLWRLACEQDIYSHDLYMKRAQLAGLEIPGSILLVDESQDMDGCQVDWVARAQVKLGAHVYVVGDPAQAIYGFRGAKSQHLMDLQSDQDLFLVRSFRFGQQIASVANCVLFAKENSDQTGLTYDGKHKNWSPYRVVAPLPKDGAVTTGSLLEGWASYGQLTLIARTNVTLFSRMIEVLSGPGTDPSKLPRVHILGDGETSGRSGFRQAFHLIEHLLKLFLMGAVSTMHLPPDLFPEFVGVPLTYTSFCEDCKNRELTRFNTVVALVEAYKEQVTEYVSLFEEQVLSRPCPASDANIILSTCHCAKGLEWENVQVCDDFLRLHSFKKIRSNGSEPSPSKKPRADERSWMFDLSWKNDEVNLLYVACTRAKACLSLPPSLAALLWCFDDLKSLVDTPVEEREATFQLPGKETLDVHSAVSLHDSLVVPLRSELGLGPNATLWESLVSGVEGSDEDGASWLHRGAAEAASPAGDGVVGGVDYPHRSPLGVSVTPDNPDT